MVRCRKRESQMSRYCLLVLLVSAFAVTELHAADEDSPFNVDVFFGWDGCYRPMEWTPVVMGISSTLTEPFDGRIVLDAQQDELNTMNITHDFVLTPDMPVRLPLVTKFAYATNECNVRVVDARRGRTAWAERFDLLDISAQGRILTAVEETDLLVGLIGRRTFGILRVPRESVCHSSQSKGQNYTGRVYLKEKNVRTAPWDWTGYVSLDLLVLYDPDWSSFRRSQLVAIQQWVSNGGRLLLVLGTHPVTQDNPLTSILPVDIGQMQSLSVPESAMKRWGLIHDQGVEANCWPLTPKAGAHTYQTEYQNDRECLFVAGYSHFGRVGVMGVEPSSLPAGQQANAGLFWTSLFAAVLEDEAPMPAEMSGGPQPGRRSSSRQNVSQALPVARTIRFVEDSEQFLDNRQYHHYVLGASFAAGNAVMEYLYRGIRPLSIWWVILLLTALAVLLGPVDYIILKRKDRLPLTWVTCTFWIVLFTVGAYYGVQALRSGDMELRVVSVHDAIADCNCTWSTDYCGLFAPRSAEYHLDGLQEDQWWSGIAPTQQNLYYRRQTGSNRIYCRQRDGFNLPYALPVNIWTVQCLLKEAPAEQVPLDADVRIRDDRLVVEVRNLSDASIAGGYVLVEKNRGIMFGHVPANSSRQFEGRADSIGEWSDQAVMRYRDTYHRHSRNLQFDEESAFFAPGSLQRTEAIKDYLSAGAAVVCAQYNGAPLTYSVDARGCSYNHIQLARLVVFPEQLQ
mgnify:CR=1 FL=1